MILVPGLAEVEGVFLALGALAVSAAEHGRGLTRKVHLAVLSLPFRRDYPIFSLEYQMEHGHENRHKG